MCRLVNMANIVIRVCIFFPVDLYFKIELRSGGSTSEAAWLQRQTPNYAIHHAVCGCDVIRETQFAYHFHLIGSVK
jgi:hypothetical protein